MFPKFRSIFLVILIFIAACAPTKSIPPLKTNIDSGTPTPPIAPNKLGVHLLLTDGRFDWSIGIWSEHMEYAREAVGEEGYVVQLVRLDDLDADRWQHFMDLCANLHLIPMLRLATTHTANGWSAPPQDADGTYRTVASQYGKFVTALKWPTDAHYIIVGNEPNHGTEWGGRPDPAAYARFLIDVADTLHTADPQIQILNAGFDAYAPHTGGQPFNDGQYYMDEETFLDGMIAAYPDIFTRLDGWASHAYPQGPFTEGPWQQSYQVDRLNGVVNPNHLKPPAGIYNRGINGYEWELFKLSSYHLPPLPIFITETGWRHAETTDTDSPDDGSDLPDAETVANYMDLALGVNNDSSAKKWAPWLQDTRVKAVVFFAFDGHPSVWGHTNWLALDPHGEVLDTYAPFESLSSARQSPTGSSDKVQNDCQNP